MSELNLNLLGSFKSARIRSTYESNWTYLGHNPNSLQQRVGVTDVLFGAHFTTPIRIRRLLASILTPAKSDPLVPPWVGVVRSRL